MNKRSMKLPTCALFILALTGCDSVEEDIANLKFAQQLIIKKDFILDAELELFEIDMLLTDAVSNRPYALVSTDGPMTVDWNGTSAEMNRIATGQLSATLNLNGSNLGVLDVTTRLLGNNSELFPLISVLQISDLPELLEVTHQDTEVVQLLWMPSSNSAINNDYLSKSEVDVKIRGLRCGDDIVDVSIDGTELLADSVYISDNMISTTFSYHLLRGTLLASNAPINMRCELDLSIATTQPIVASTRERLTLPIENSIDSDQITLSIDERWANSIVDTHTFKYYSEKVTFFIEL